MVITENTSLAYLEAKGLAKCFKAYADYLAGENILEVGFNPKSGYVYIAMEFDSISIGSLCGGDAEFIYTDPNTGEETFYDTFECYEKNRICDFIE